jgi:ParB/RepB/Spo0J family partition protein
VTQTETRNGHALLDEHELAEAGPPEAIRLPLELVDANPQNPRGKLIEIDALAENIRQFGLLQPVTVRRMGERYELLGGHRRAAAFALLRDRLPLEPQWRTIPAVVRTFGDDDSYLALISSQVHSKSWKPREEAAALERLVIAGRNLKQIGAALNHSEAWASKRLRVYADAVVSGYVQTGKLAAGVAEELLPILDVETRKQFAERAVAEGWTQDQARQQVRGLRLSSQLGNLGRKARDLVELLSQIEGNRITVDVFRDLWTLHGRVEVLAAQARGDQPRVPSIEEAEKVAGVTPAAKDRAERQRKERQRAARKARRVSAKA